MAVPGEGRLDARVMIIGEGPGSKEDKTGRPFVGSAGKYLDHILAGTAFTRDDFFITNIVKCRPPGNRTPRSQEVEICTSLYLFNQIRLLNPKLILLLGSVAVSRLLGLKSVDEARGRIIEKDGRKFLASYHPAVRFYREDLAKKIKEDFALLTHELARSEVARSPEREWARSAFEQPEQKRQDQAEQQASGYRKVEAEISSRNLNIPGQSPQPTLSES